MMAKKLLFLIITCLSIFTLMSCKKESLKSEIESTFDLASKNATNELMTEDVNNILMATTDSFNLSGARVPNAEMGLPACATITVTGSFPNKHITIDFHDSCVGSDNVTRSGIIHVVLTNYIRTAGSVATVTFENYKRNGYQKEGTVTWTNTSNSPSAKSWHRVVVNGKITAPDGRYWLHESDKTLTQVAGITTQNNSDDAYSISGSGSVTNEEGKTRTAEIITALHKQVSCSNIDEGSIKFQGPNHYALIDFGNGYCDNIATVSIDGYTPRTITLR